MKRTYDGPDVDGTVQHLSEAPYWQNDGETVDVVVDEPIGTETVENVPDLSPERPDIEGQSTLADWGVGRREPQRRPAVARQLSRVRSREDVDRERFRTLVKSVLWTLEAKGLTIHRQRASEYALQRFTDGDDIDEALAVGVSAGLSSRTRTDRARAD